MSSSHFSESRDTYENAYFQYVEALRVLASRPEEACEKYGHFNVAGELWLELRSVAYLFESPESRLSPEHIAALRVFSQALETLPHEATSYTEVAEGSLERLRHSSWALPRRLAAQLLEALEPITEKNAAYIFSSKAI